MIFLFNNDGFMDKYKSIIYPSELALSSDDKDERSVNYLDLNLETKDNIINYKIYDKRDKFPFKIVNFPDLTGNIPKSLLWSFTSQLIRFARGCKFYEDFKFRAKYLFDRLIKQKFKKSKLYILIKN